MRRILVVDVDHVSPPVVLPRERLPSKLGVCACRLGAVEGLGLLVLVVNVAFQMCLGTKPLAAARMCAFVWPFVVASMVTVSWVSLGGMV